MRAVWWDYGVEGGRVSGRRAFFELGVGEREQKLLGAKIDATPESEHHPHGAHRARIDSLNKNLAAFR